MFKVGDRVYYESKYYGKIYKGFGTVMISHSHEVIITPDNHHEDKVTGDMITCYPNDLCILESIYNSSLYRVMNEKED